MNFKKILNGIYDNTTPYNQLSLLGKATRVLVLSVHNFISAENKKQCTVLTYYTLFAIVPLLALFFGIAKGFSLDEKLKNFLAQKFADHGDTFDWIYRFADTTLQQARGGVVAGVGIIVLFFTVVMLASNVEDTFNKVWHLPKRKNIFRKASDYLSILVITPILLIIAGSTTVISTPMINELATRVPSYLRELLPLLFIAVDLLPLIVSWGLFFAIYFLVPNTKVRVLSALAAAIVAGTFFQIFQSSLLYLQIALSKYNTIYGSFAALPLFLIWLQWSWMIVLFGAELGFVHQNAAIGRFEGEKLKLNLRSRRYYLFGIIKIVSQNYEAGRAPITEELLTRDLQLTLYQIRDYLNSLIDCGILVKTISPDGEIGFVPALPPEMLTIGKVTAMLEGYGDNPVEYEPALNNIIATADRLRTNMEKDPDNKPLVKL